MLSVSCVYLVYCLLHAENSFWDSSTLTCFHYNFYRIVSSIPVQFHWLFFSIKFYVLKLFSNFWNLLCLFFHLHIPLREIFHSPFQFWAVFRFNSQSRYYDVISYVLSFHSADSVYRVSHIIPEFLILFRKCVFVPQFLLLTGSFILFHLLYILHQPFDLIS